MNLKALKKYKLENFLLHEKKTFLVCELLPIKESSFVALVQNFNNLGFEVKSFKTKGIAALLRSVLKIDSLKTLKAFEQQFKGNLVLFYLVEKTTKEQALSFKEILTLLQKQKDFVPLMFFHQGSFFHTQTLNHTKKSEENILAIENSLNQGVKATTYSLDQPLISVIKVLDFKSFL